VWQWVRHGAHLEDGQPLTADRFHRIVDDELQRLRTTLGPARYDAGRFAEARSLFERMSTSETFNEFLTLPAYDELLALFGSVGPRP
jgi:malate synthase